MPEFQHRIVGVTRSPGAKAMRAAVLLPVVGVEALKDVPAAMERLVYYWHSRVSALAASDDVRDFWLKSPRATVYARNCPPFGVKLAASARPCNRPLFCPFCYARRFVLPAYLAAEKLFTPPLTLWVREETRGFEGACQAVDWLRKERRLDSYGPRRPTVTAATAWPRDGYPVLRLVRFAAWDGEGEPDFGRLRECKDVWDLAGTVGNQLRLPEGYLRSEPLLLVNMAIAFRGVRMVSRTGR